MARLDSVVVDEVEVGSDGTVRVYWRRGTCQFRGLPSSVIEVFRAFRDTSMPREDRREEEISIGDTTLQVAALWGCTGKHSEPCPRGGPWEFSVVDDRGVVDAAKLRLLRMRW